MMVGKAFPELQAAPLHRAVKSGRPELHCGGFTPPRPVSSPANGGHQAHLGRADCDQCRQGPPSQDQASLYAQPESQIQS